MNIEALLLSIRLALCVSAILFVIGVPLGYWLAYSQWRWKFLLEAVVALPLVLPPTVLGFYMLLAMGPRGPLGKLWQAAFGHGLAFTFAGLVSDPLREETCARSALLPRERQSSCPKR